MINDNLQIAVTLDEVFVSYGVINSVKLITKKISSFYSGSIRSTSAWHSCSTSHDGPSSFRSSSIFGNNAYDWVSWELLLSYIYLSRLYNWWVSVWWMIKKLVFPLYYSNSSEMWRLTYSKQNGIDSCHGVAKVRIIDYW